MASVTVFKGLLPELARFTEISPPQKMFYHLQNLFWGFLAWGVLSGGFCRGVYVRGGFVGGVYVRGVFVRAFFVLIPFMTSTLNVRWCIHSILKQGGVVKEADKPVSADDCTKKKHFSSSLQGYFSNHYYFPL